jgi:hypothetical protein
MTVTVFVWDMLKGGPHNGVGHASMHVNGPSGNIYISFWPAKHALKDALYSEGKVHFMTGDKKEDGMPSWASKPIDDLDEGKIIKFWNEFDPSSALDYKGSASKNITKTNEGGKIYNILFSQCSTTVVGALLAGAAPRTRDTIMTWLAANAGTNVDFSGIRSISRYVPIPRLPTVTPADVRELVKSVWKDF